MGYQRRSPEFRQLERYPHVVDPAPWPPYIHFPCLPPWRPWPPGDPVPFIYKDLLEKLDLNKQIEVAKIRADYVQKVQEIELSYARQIQEISMAQNDKMLKLHNEFSQKLTKAMG